MEMSLTWSGGVALFTAMLGLAVLPDASAFAVVARAVGAGFTHGMVVLAGIVAGDFVFILLAVYGLGSLADSLGGWFIVVKYLGGVYLLFLGIRLWRVRPNAEEIAGIREMSWGSNFLCGLLITLGDPKAILFYVSFLARFC